MTEDKFRERAYEKLYEIYRDLAVSLMTEADTLARYEKDDAELRERVKGMGNEERRVAGSKFLSKENDAIRRTLEHCLGITIQI